MTYSCNDAFVSSRNGQEENSPIQPQRVQVNVSFTCVEHGSLQPYVTFVPSEKVISVKISLAESNTEPSGAGGGARQTKTCCTFYAYASSAIVLQRLS